MTIRAFDHALLLLLIGGAMLAAASAAQAETASQSWRITHALAAPWGDPIAGAQSLAGQTLMLGDGTLRGPQPLDCQPARIETLTLPAEGLFEGSLPAPADNAARALGLSAFPVETLRVTCANAGFDLHRADANTLLIGLDNRVWVLSDAAGAAAAPDSPTGVVQRLLEAHFNGDMAFTPEGVATKTDLLTPTLHREMAAYFSLPVPEDEAPFINGDPFTDSQEYPTRFAVGEATVEGATATLSVHFADGWRAYAVQYLLVQVDEGWRVDDLVLAGNVRLRALLSER